MIAEEAYKQLMDISDRDVLSQSQNVRLRDWLELMEEVSRLFISMIFCALQNLNTW